MTEFKNVTVKKAANVFFDGKVTSRTVTFPDGSRKTLGIMQPGEFEFKIGDREIMEILSGDLEVFLEGEKGWKRINGGTEFAVPAGTTFKLKVHALTDYCCSFIKT